MPGDRARGEIVWSAGARGGNDGQRLAAIEVLDRIGARCCTAKRRHDERDQRQIYNMGCDRHRDCVQCG